MCRKKKKKKDQKRDSQKIKKAEEHFKQSDNILNLFCLLKGTQLKNK